MVIRWGLGKFLNQFSSQTAAHTIKLHVIAINMYWILLLLYDYALKSCDYIVTNVLWFKDSCILPLRYRLNFNNKIKHFNHKIKEKGRPFFKHLSQTFFFFSPPAGVLPSFLWFFDDFTGCFSALSISSSDFSCSIERQSVGFSQNYTQASIFTERPLNSLPIPSLSRPWSMVFSLFDSEKSIFLETQMGSYYFSA